jgi:deoxyadenosine/deoxycytidine kinase
MTRISNQKKLVRIEVCGGIASGKTTFANLMELKDFNPVLENFQINPFLADWYQNPAKYVFETEISFILQHYHQIKKEHIESKINICDFSFLIDLAYAEIGLQGSKLDAFRIIHGEIKRDLPPPSLLIHLDCDPKTELKRIRARARDIEKSITLEFLDTLNKAVERQVKDAQEKIKTITINSAIKNFADDDKTKEEISNYIAEIFSK